MVDSIGMLLPDGKIPIDKLHDIKPCYNGYSGKLRNMMFKDTNTGLYISGSLPKFFNGNNTIPLNFQLLEDALGTLETVSGLSLKKAYLYQLEIGFTFNTISTPNNYLSLWEMPTRYQMLIYSHFESVTYINKTNSFIGYDKGKEQSDAPLPELFKRPYALRLELRRKKSMKRFFKREIRPWDLINPELFLQAVKSWEKFYFKIPKRRLVPFSASLNK